MENLIAGLNVATSVEDQPLVSNSTYNVLPTELCSPPLALSTPTIAPSKPVGLALFGVGRWGTHLLRNFLSQPQAQVMAIVDPVLERLAPLAQQHGLDDRVVLTTDWQQALQVPGLEAVVVATPAVTHFPLIRAALQQQLHVLAEKPLTLESKSALELCELANQQQRQLVVDHTYLFHPAIRQGQTLIKRGDLGDLRYGYAARTHLGPVRQDVDALWDLAIHDIAIFNHWLNATPVKVQAQGMNWLQIASSGPIAPTGLSDLVWVQLTYPNGFQAVIHLCWSNPDKQRRLSIVGSQGTLVFDELSSMPLRLLQGRLEPQQQQFIPVDQQQQVIDLETVEPLQQVCAHFLDCVQHNRASWLSSGWLGAELVEILVALTRSLQQGGTPVDLPDR